jgi:hypothetical protein
MMSMGDHSGKDQNTAAARHQAAGAPMRRARLAAWCVFIGMAGTSMTFQTYHAITAGQMNPWLAFLYGVVPLAISIGVLEFAAVWGVLWAQLASYGIALGAMFESASATGAVTGHAGPAHAELVFGLILDAAALLAIAFINHGPTAAAVVAAVIAREGELLDAVRAAQSAAREAALLAAETEAGLRAQLAQEQAAKRGAAAEAQTALRDAVRQAQADAQNALDDALQTAAEASKARENALRQEIDGQRHAREIAEQGADRWSEAEDRRIAAEIAQASSAGELRTTREALDAAIEARNAAESRAANAEAQAATLTRKLTAVAGAKRARKNAPAAADAGGRAGEAKVPNDVDAQAEALSILADEPDIKGAALGPRVGKSERWGQLFLQRLAARPVGGESPEAD